MRSHTCYKICFHFQLLVWLNQASIFLHFFVVLLPQDYYNQTKRCQWEQNQWQIQGLTDAAICLSPPFEIRDQVVSWLLKEKTYEYSFHSVFKEWLTPSDYSKTTALRQWEAARAPTAATRQRNAVSHLLHTLQRALCSGFLCRQDSFVLLKYSMHGREYFSSSGG